MLSELLIAAAALTGASTSSDFAGPDYDLHEHEILVEAERSTDRWSMPDLDSDVPEGCPSFLETQLPGFGTLRIGPACSNEPTDQPQFWPQREK